MANSAKGPLTRYRAKKAAEGGEKIMKKIDQQGEAIEQIGIIIMPVSKDEDLFREACRKVESMAISVNCRLGGLSHL